MQQNKEAKKKIQGWIPKSASVAGVTYLWLEGPRNVLGWYLTMRHENSITLRDEILIGLQMIILGFPTVPPNAN